MNKFFKSALCAALALFIVQTGFACTNVLVTKGASKDGSILITYSADSHQLYGELYFTPAGFFKPGTWMNINEWDSGKYLGQIPQLVGQTYQTVGNMNEHQLIITETTFGGRRELGDPDGIMDYGSLIYITLQRAKTAREAIQTIVDLANEYGYASSGESFSIADKDEVWIMELIGKGSKLDKKGRNINKGGSWSSSARAASSTRRAATSTRVSYGPQPAYLTDTSAPMPIRPVSTTSCSMTLRTGSMPRTWWTSPARWVTSRVLTRSSASATHTLR